MRTMRSRRDADRGALGAHKAARALAARESLLRRNRCRGRRRVDQGEARTAKRKDIKRQLHRLFWVEMCSSNLR